MVDVTKVETEVNYALDLAERLLPWVSMVIPGAGPVVAILTKAIVGVRIIEAQLNVTTSAAIAHVDAHLTPGAPNSPVLGTNQG